MEAYFWQRLLSTLFDDLTAAGIGVLTASDAAPEMLQRYSLDAIVTASTDIDDDPILRSLPNVPKIVGGSPAPHAGYSTIGHDSAQMTLDALNHLYEQGFRRPILLVRSVLVQVIREPATTGYLQWCEEHSVEPLILESVQLPDAGPQVKEAIATGYDSMCAIVANNPGVLRLLTVDSDLRVPDDIGFVGLGEDVGASITTPTITTVSTLGAKAGHLVAGLISDVLEDGEPASLVLPHRLNVRESSVRI